MKHLRDILEAILLRLVLVFATIVLVDIGAIDAGMANFVIDMLT